MPPRTGQTESLAETPDEMFSVIANETRLEVLRTLGEADDPLRFSELFERVDYSDAPNFNYHLKRLKGHFIEDTETGYVLLPEGERVVKAVLAGFMSDKPEVERAQVDTACFMCGGDEMEVSYRNGGIRVFCPECQGSGDPSHPPTGTESDESDSDLIGNVGLPSAGVWNRSPTDILRVGELWSCWMAHASARNVCPECSAPIDHSVQVCDDHATGDGRCETCGLHSGVTVTSTCTHCIRDQRFDFAALLLANPDVMAFMIDHGLDPLIPRAFHHSSLEADILSTDPLKAHFTFSAGDETLTLTVDDDLDVVDVTRSHDPEAE